MGADQTEHQEERTFIKTALTAMNKGRKNKHDMRQGYSEWEEHMWRLFRRSRFTHLRDQPRSPIIFKFGLQKCYIK